MSRIKKEHTKYGKAMVLSLVIEEFIKDNVSAESRDKEYHEQLKELLISHVISDKEHVKLSRLREVRNALNHDPDKIPFNKNEDFKEFLKEMKKFCKKHTIYIPEYSDDKYKQIGLLIYSSADAEALVNEECEKHNIALRNSGKRVSFLHKCNELSKIFDQKSEVLKVLSGKWSSRNDVIHKKVCLDKITETELETLSDAIDELLSKFQS